MSYNHQNGVLLQSQNYANCIRQEDGFCGIQYSTSDTTSPDPFSLDATGVNAMVSHFVSKGFVNYFLVTLPRSLKYME